MGHPDFQVGGKIFATLGYLLRTARKAAVREALRVAWRNRAPQ